ncbi:hypothetical protein F383_27085 [Gossypium arboreum]|uniref:Uncharacterized protein n=1 Tax=Gossypium arboreum TaxID=29729 RepID=A0A0B0P478_GOSAR|nr:hypothetical protein F383_27085 [Gossypium arboreum]
MPLSQTGSYTNQIRRKSQIDANLPDVVLHVITYIDSMVLFAHINWYPRS